MAIEVPYYLPGGKALFNGGQPVERPSDCCCDGEPCAYCENGVNAPRRFRVTFSDVVLCPDCVPFDMIGGDYSVKWTDPPPALSGAYVLDNDYACRYSNGDPSSPPATGEWSVWDDPILDCSGSPDYVRTSYNLQIVLDVSAAGVFLVARYMSSAGLEARLFDDNVLTSAPCGGITVLTNQLTSCGGLVSPTSSWMAAATGGTATVVPL